MAKLTEDVQIRIVQELACFRTPTEVVEVVKEEFGLTVTKQQVQFYDPEHGPKPAARWCELFEKTRKAFIEQGASLAITHRNWRVRELEDMARRAKNRGAYKLAADLLKQAAEDLGDSYVNRRSAPPAAGDTEEERIARLRAALTAMDETIGAGAAPAVATGPRPVERVA